MDFVTAVKRPFANGKNFCIGSFLYLLAQIPFIGMIIGFFPQGYALVCAKKSIGNDHSLPEWKEWGDFFFRGVISTVIGFLYYVPAVILLLVLFGKVLFSALMTIAQSGTPTTEMITNLMLDVFTSQNMIFLCLIIFLFMLTIYVVPMAILSYLSNDKFGDAFNLKNVFRKAFSFNYFKAMLFVILYGLGVIIILGILSAAFGVFGKNAIFYINIVLSSMTAYIMGVTSMTLFGMAYADIEHSERIVSKPAVKKKVVKKSKKK